MNNQSTTKELHVIFGTGPLGKWTARHLTEMGKSVRLVNRSGKATNLPPTAELVTGDAYDAAQVQRLTEGAAAVYQCSQPDYTAWSGNFQRMQASLLAGAQAAGAKFIAAENIYMYGDTHGQPVTEKTPYNAHTKKGKVRQEMTESLMQAHEQGKVRVAMVRGSDFFGPEDTIYQGLWFQPALDGKGLQFVGRKDVPHTFTYAPDFGKLLALVGTRDEALGQAWHVPSDAPTTQGQIAQWIEAEVGRKVNAQFANSTMVWLLGRFVPTVNEIHEMMYEFNQPFIMDSSKAERAFGFHGTPIRQAIRETVAWVKANPLVKH